MNYGMNVAAEVDQFEFVTSCVERLAISLKVERRTIDLEMPVTKINDIRIQIVVNAVKAESYDLIFALKDIVVGTLLRIEF